jgi:DNA-binding MarR family transcriptional regulator
VHPASVTNAVDRLEAQGLARRTPHPTDRRATLVEITDDGRAVAAKATDELNATVFASPGLSPDGVERLVAVLTDLRGAAGDF